MSFSLVQKLRNKIRIDEGNHIDISDAAKIVGCKIVIKGKNNKLIISERSRVLLSSLQILGDGCSIIIAENCMIGDNCYIVAREKGTCVYIGENCGFSRNVKIMNSDGHYIYKNNKRVNEAKDITINANTWIADSVVVLKGVNIGTGCVIGIGSIVTKSAPPFSLIAGNPAKVIKSDINWEP